MIRHPCRYYIHYLLSKRTHSTEALIRLLDELRVPLPQTEKAFKPFVGSIVTIKDKMLFPPQFDPTAKALNAGTRQFLARWGIRGMWTRDRYVGIATDLLYEPMIRRMIEALLLGPINPAAIAERVAARFGLPNDVMNVRVINAYRHYFWNVGSLSLTEWKILVNTWLGESSGNPTEYNADYLAAINAPRSEAGAALLLALTDRSADSLSSTEIFTTFRDMGFNMFMQHALLNTKPSLHRTQAAFMAFQMVRSAEEDLDRHRGSSTELLEHLNKLQTAYDTETLPTVAELPLLDDSVIDVVAETEDTNE